MESERQENCASFIWNGSKVFSCSTFSYSLFWSICLTSWNDTLEKVFNAQQTKRVNLKSF